MLMLVVFFLTGIVFCFGEEKITYGITHVVWFEIEAKGLDGPGDDFRGKFVIL